MVHVATPFDWQWPGAGRGPRWGTPVSVGLHAGFMALALLASPVRPVTAPPVRGIAVDIVTEGQLAALRAPAPAPAIAAATGAVPLPAPGESSAPAAGGSVAPPTAPRVDGLTVASQFFAGAILASAGGARIRAGLRAFADNERMVQLCDIEGLEQIRRADPSLDPDLLVPYALGEVVTSGSTLVAEGGAFRNQRKWYAIRFRCTVSAGMEGVEAFAFRIGDAIPEREWAPHDLFADDAEPD